MGKMILICVMVVFAITACSDKTDKIANEIKSGRECKDDGCCKKANISSGAALSCKLTSPELQNRKATILSALRKQVLEKKELVNGYAFKFDGSDKMIDELTEFVKSERQCCDFFVFNIQITGDTQTIWFEITGVPEVKDFIKTELEL